MEPVERRDTLLEASKVAMAKGDRIRAKCLARDARIICYLYDLPIPAGEAS